MAELNYKNLKDYIKKLAKEQVAPVYLLYGEEFLYRTALEALLDFILSASGKNLNYESVSGTNEHIDEIVERISTYSLLSGPKVIAVLDSKIFYTNLDTSVFLEKTKAAYVKNDIKKASKYLLDLMAVLKLSYDDIADGEERSQRLKYDVAALGDDDWLNELLMYCSGNRLPIPASRDGADLLQRSIEKGFPKGNHLIITTDVVDKRTGLFKTIRDLGAVIDCSVPKGERRADRTAQEAVLNDQMRSILARSQKKMTKEAYDGLIEMTGFDLRTFSSNLEKLIDYVGKRSQIDGDDVAKVLRRSKKDPLFELTNAVAEQNFQNAVFYLNSLLADNVHPLQILTAVTNLVRRLLVIRDFMESPYGEVFQGQPVNYNRFKERVIPAIQAYDSDVLNLLENWDKIIHINKDAENTKPSKKKSRKQTDLVIVKNPHNPYPVFQMYQKASAFSKRSLIEAFETLSDADIQMKSTPRNPQIILERVMFAICQQDEK